MRRALTGAILSIPVSSTFTCLADREADLVVGCLLPWSHAVPHFAWRCSTAILSGSAILVKPCELASLAGLHLASLAREAGLPPGLIAVLPGPAATGQIILGPSITQAPDPPVAPVAKSVNCILFSGRWPCSYCNTPPFSPKVGDEIERHCLSSLPYLEVTSRPS